jgi:hypothetical protein
MRDTLWGLAVLGAAWAWGLWAGLEEPPPAPGVPTPVVQASPSAQADPVKGPPGREASPPLHPDQLPVPGELSY